ncbi:serine/threonine-protein kinase [Pseudofulvimonas gallinarii]|uniref:Non-specific serine/threonine protein kinase/serine/threonine-protein kinase n=2 Tax=Pseudofulvimonas gallinarii TaxID=634155 RepID=A0A4R3LPV8_9GAMM|nr:serine/threonine-protein kinase [Pseudofulvimonas gallinarii]TCT00057.1 non-specific serine/threonine protein kinase/serine/threonine-protein kinase [Pseudofulvimonas gallinarii]
MLPTGETDADDADATRRLETRTDEGVDAPEAGVLAPGTLVGHYRVVARIGSGGMGAIYRAEQLQPVRRTVALKLLRGRLSTRQRAYFEIERQTLAQMQHPAIAQIFDAGTTEDGVPWFAMEFIEGSPITEVARDLSLDQRLALLARVCDAIQHAHQKGVVHRDLKPGNILVTRVDGEWLPKIIDFGIATAAARAGLADAAVEGPVDMAGTPEYMSPEQLEGRLASIDTRSDVYALGVVLYELIVGDRPGIASQSGRTASSTRSGPLTAPSQRLRSRRLPTGAASPRRGRLRELDRVVLTAMAHDRNDRYPSAIALADELRRYLAHLPLQAMPATPGYLLRRFARRHRLWLASGAAVLLTLVGGLVLSLHAFNQARIQRGVAEARQHELEQVVAFQQAMLSDIDVMDMGRRLVGHVRDQLSRRSERDTVLQVEQLPGILDGPSLARAILVESVLKRAESIIGQRFETQPALAADLLQSVGEVYHAIGQYDEAVAALQSVLEQRVALPQPDLESVVDAQVALANSLERSGQFDAAEAMASEAVATVERLPLDSSRHIAATMVRAQVARSKIEYGKARQWYEKALDAALRIHPADHPEVARARQQYALSLHLDGASDQARPQFEQVLSVQRGQDGNWQQLVGVLVNYAALLADTGDVAAALELEREAYALNRQHLGADHPLTLMILNNMGMSMMEAGDPVEAMAALEEAAEGRARVLGPEHPHTLRSRASLARALVRLDRHDQALAIYSDVYTMRRRILGPGSLDTYRVGRSLADLLKRMGRHEQMLSLTREMHASLVQTQGPWAEDTIDVAIQTARAMVDIGRPDDAIRRLRELLDAASAQSVEAGDERYALAVALYELYRGQGRDADADDVRRRHLRPLLETDGEQLAPRLRRLRETVLRVPDATASAP